MDIKQDTINAEEMAKRLNTTSSNIRKWCIELEKHGYEFVKDNRKSVTILLLTKLYCQT